VAGEKEKDDAVDDIDDVICAGKEVPALELGAFRLRSFVSVPFETRNSSHIDAILSTPNCKEGTSFHKLATTHLHGTWSPADDDSLLCNN